MPQHTVADVVTWTSSAGGGYVAKTGPILQVVEANASAFEALATCEDGQVPKGRRMFESDRMATPRYLVGVKTSDRSQKLRYYCPRCDLVDPQMAQAARQAEVNARRAVARG